MDVLNFRGQPVDIHQNTTGFIPEQMLLIYNLKPRLFHLHRLRKMIIAQIYVESFIAYVH
jgi:hypothetical protein